MKLFYLYKDVLTNKKITNEADTRRKYVSPNIYAAGWDERVENEEV